MTLLDACREVMNDPEVRARYPEGLNAAEILGEIRVRHGEDAFPYITVIDVADEMRYVYGIER